MGNILRRRAIETEQPQDVPVDVTSTTGETGGTVADQAVGLLAENADLVTETIAFVHTVTGTSILS